MPTLQHPPSYYAASANPSPDRPPLNGHIETDICIIGAGYTGLSTGISLAERGYRVCILEAAQVGFGASGRNGGQIVNSYSRDLDSIEQQVAPAAAQIIGQAAFEGARLIRQHIHRYSIDCNLKNGGIFAAITDKQMKHLEAQAKLWARYGYTNIELLDTHGIRQNIDSKRYKGGMLDKTGGHIHPLNLALGEAKAVEQLGGKIYENSPAIKITRTEKPTAHTPNGSVTANFLVIAGNAYLGGLIPELAARSMPCGTQMIATEPLSEAQAKQLLPQDYCVEDCNYLLDYYRLSQDRRLLYGGGVAYGARTPDNIESFIRPKLGKTFPHLKDIRFDYAWTGNFLMTLSRLPQIGRLTPQIYYSQGCSGHGVTYTHLAGAILAEAINGQAERIDAFSQLPHYPFPGGQHLAAPLSTLGAMYYSLRDKLGI